MKVISIWQPFSTLLLMRYKFFETRTWPAPQSVIGQRIGIASTKVITPGQRDHFNDPEFRQFYDNLGLPDLEDLPRGYLLGTALLEDVELMTEEFLAEVSREEQAYGWWQPGYYAWRMADPVLLTHPIPIRGKQGIYNWEGDLSNAQTEGCTTPDP